MLPLADIKQYIELCNQGNSTAEERYNIILKQKEKAEQEVIKMEFYYLWKYIYKYIAILFMEFILFRA